MIGSRIYISRVKDGVAFSDDYGESWTTIPDGLPAQPPDKFAAVGTTLFAKVDDVIIRLREGETSWEKTANIPGPPISHRRRQRIDYWKSDRFAPFGLMKAKRGWLLQTQ